jgi:pimeloyl-ACP methyl ester carboxylesterase
MHVAEQGEGPAIILCHGFPETWYSWRHQLQSLSDAGYRVIAPDMRGYGQTDQPDPIHCYTILHLVGDMVGLLDALHLDTVIIVGHDWGAVVAWHAALLRPDRFRAVAALSVPFMPRAQIYTSRTLPSSETEVFYQEYFQTPGVAEAWYEKDVRQSVRSSLFGFSGEAPIAPPSKPLGMIPRAGVTASHVSAPSVLPPWITEQDVDVYAEQFKNTGYRGGLNWYRNIDRNWELLTAFGDLSVSVPALFIAGTRDPVLAFPGMDQIISNLKQKVP